MSAQDLAASVCALVTLRVAGGGGAGSGAADEAGSDGWATFLSFGGRPRRGREDLASVGKRWRGTCCRIRSPRC